MGDWKKGDVFEATELNNGLIRIGLISDTHIPRDAKMLPPHVREAFKDVDLILHAGDIYQQDTLDELESMAPVLAARGNGDRRFPEDHRLDENQVIDIAGLSLGLTHAVNYPPFTGYPFTHVMEREFGKSVDIIIFGDTHVTMIARYEGVLLVNPGSPTLPNGRFKLGTVGILEIKGKAAEARIIPLSELPLPFHKEIIYYRGAGA